jgi:hypothetical protein
MGGPGPSVLKPVRSVPSPCPPPPCNAVRVPRFPTSLARESLERLAARHRVTLAWMRRGQDPEGAQSYPPLRIAICPAPTNGYRYLIALHELGHCVSPVARKHEDQDDVYNVGLCEGAAWAWAAANRHPDVPVPLDAFKAAGALLAGYWAFPWGEAE